MNAVFVNTVVIAAARCASGDACRGIASDEQRGTLSLALISWAARDRFSRAPPGFLVAMAFHPELSHLRCSVHRFRDLVPRTAFSRLRVLGARR